MAMQGDESAEVNLSYGMVGKKNVKNKPSPVVGNNFLLVNRYDLSRAVRI